MSKRRYTNMVALLPVIEGMLAAGMSRREIEDDLGLEGDRPVHNLLKRLGRPEQDTELAKKIQERQGKTHKKKGQEMVKGQKYS